MKANEFVRKFGLSSFKVAMICPQFSRYNYAILYSNEVDFSNKLIDKHANYMFKTSDIKSLVASWELVDSFGGLSYAERFLNENVPCIDSVRLEKAIADVESCQ